MKRLLRREEAAQYLTEQGLRTSKVTLARQAMIGAGAKYTLIGKTAYYTKEWLDEWIESKLKPHNHTLFHKSQNGE